MPRRWNEMLPRIFPLAGGVYWLLTLGLRPKMSVESLNRDFVSNESTPGGSYPHHEIRVPCRRFRSLLEEFEVIQGNDFLCVEGLDPYQLPRPSYVL